MAKQQKAKATPAPAPAPAPIAGPQAIAVTLVQAYLKALTTWFVQGYCPLSGQGKASAGGMVTCAYHVVLAAGHAVQAKAIVGGLLHATQGQGIKHGTNCTGAATSWAPNTLMAYVHGYVATAQGLARVSVNGAPTVHPVLQTLVKGAVYHPWLHPALPAKYHVPGACAKAMAHRVNALAGGARGTGKAPYGKRPRAPVALQVAS